MLFGRDDECARVDALLDAARARRSGALVLRGEAGIGKSALLDYAVAQADGFEVLRALGVESEAEIAFAGAQQLLRPIMAAVAELPDVQATALARAFALEDGPAPERLTVGAAVLSVLAAAADERPLMCVVDDAHWLDHASADTLTFAARRLHAEQVAVLFAAREPETAVFPAPGVPDLRVAPLTTAAARALLADRAPGLAEPAAERLIKLAEGNPLALVEISQALSQEQRLGREPLDPRLPLGVGVERAFLDRVGALNEDAQRGLLLVAAGDPADAETLWRALAASGLDAAIEEAEAAALLFPRRLQFCHPLARSAVYERARPAERRAAHALLADASEPDRRAWHLAAAADGPDEDVAAALEDAAAAARGRGGVVAEARALQRAAQLTADAEGRARRLLKAALVAESAGWLERAEAMLAEVAEVTQDADLRAQAVARQSYLLFDRGEFDQSYELAVAEADSTAEDGPVSPATSGTLRILWRRLDIRRALDIADRAHRASQPDEPNLDLATVVAWTWVLGGRVDDGWRLARKLLEQTDPGSWLAIDFGNVLLYAEDYAGGRHTLEQVVARARAAGAPGILSYALDQLSKLETRVGNLTRAYALELESLQLTEPLGNDVGLAACLLWLGLLESILGRPECREHAERALAIANRMGDPWNGIRAHGVLGLDALVRGDPAAAVEWLRPAVATIGGADIHPNYLRVDGDLIEALTRIGDADGARSKLERLERQARATRSPWAQVTAARCRAFLAAEAELEAAFELALELHEREPSMFERARTELCYGERLRRAGERRAAREQLGAALARVSERLPA